MFLHWNAEVRDAFFFILVYKTIPLPPALAAPGESGRFELKHNSLSFSVKFRVAYHPPLSKKNRLNREKISDENRDKLLASPMQVLCNVLEVEIQNAIEKSKSQGALTTEIKKIGEIRPNKASKVLGKPVNGGQEASIPKKANVLDLPTNVFSRKKQNMQQDAPTYIGSYKSDTRSSKETLKVIHSHLLAQLFAYPKSGTAAVSEPVETNERLLVYAPAAVEAFHRRLRDFLKQIGNGAIEIPPNLGLRSE